MIFKNSQGVTYATGTMTVNLEGAHPTIIASVTDKFGNRLDMETVEYDLSATIRYQSTISVGGATYSAYFDVIKEGPPLDPFADPVNAATIQQISSALSAYPKLQKAVAAAVHIQPQVAQQNGPYPAESLKVLGCVVIATGGLVAAALSCSTLVLCGVGLGFALGGLAYCAV